MGMEDRFLQLLPTAVQWVGEQADEVMARGRPLTPGERRLAEAVGVSRPECVRLLEVHDFPGPDDPDLRELATEIGLLGPDLAGITFGYAIMVAVGEADARLLSHEFRHVSQYEEHGSVDDFLAEYFRQIVRFGYSDAPLEVDARRHERTSWL